MLDFVQTQVDRARKGRVEQQKVGDASRRQITRMDAPKGVVTRGRAQYRMPLTYVNRRRRRPKVLGQYVVLVVEQAGRLIGALDIAPELVKVRGLVAIKGTLGDASEGLASFLDLGQQPRQVAGR